MNGGTPAAAVLAGTLLALGAVGAGAAEKAGADFQAPQEREFKATYDGSMQKYVVLLPREYKGGEHDVLLAFHGHGSDRQQYVTQTRGECAGARDVASRRKMIFVSPDYRGNSWMGPAAEADMVQLIGELKKTYKVRRVFLVGGSMGGTAVLTFAALHPELVAGVSSQNGMANLLEYTVNKSNIQVAIKDSFGGRKDELPEDYKKRNRAEYEKRSAELHPGKFTMPLAITVGLKDEIVPPASVLRLAEAVRKKNKHVLVIQRETGGHSTNFDDTVKALEFVVEAAGRK
jgi:dipeptidyl aminopeptidase/acylaminoacyl peptidase